MLSRLVKASKHDLSAITLEQFESLFLTIREAQQGQRTEFERKPYITLGCVQTVQGRLQNLLHYLTSLQHVPYLAMHHARNSTQGEQCG